MAAGRMKILFVVKQKKNVDTFLPTIRLLVDRGHRVALAVQEWSERRDDDYRAEIPSPLFSVVRCPLQRADEWGDAAALLRSLRDCAHYQQPARYRELVKGERIRFGCDESQERDAY